MSQPLPLFVIRNGLPRVARRLAAGRAVTVAFLGGSITQTGGERDGYRGLTGLWLRERFPKATITEINAGVGGTGSDLGAFRLRQDVLVHKPDLLFVEFAVNDGNESHDVSAAMEGIVRHTRREFPSCDIAFIYTLAQRDLAAHQGNILPPASRLHEPIAEHYGLPSINVALDVSRRLDQGEQKWDEFSRDNCHPHPRGHELYARTIGKALEEALAVKPRRGAVVLPCPFNKRPWEHAELVTINAKKHAFEGWTYKPLVNRGGWECFDGVLECDRSGFEAAFEFHGSAVGLYYQLGPDSGHIRWSLDGGPFKTVKVFDRFAVTCTRPHCCTLVEGLHRGKHVLRVRATRVRDERSTGNWIRLAHLMVR